MENEATLGSKYEALFQHLDERQRRLVAAADAEHLGRGGVSIVARASRTGHSALHIIPTAWPREGWVVARKGQAGRREVGDMR
jgi:hypothetical protein